VVVVLLVPLSAAPESEVVVSVELELVVEELLLGGLTTTVEGLLGAAGLLGASELTMVVLLLGAPATGTTVSGAGRRAKK
jgi:hypothetical protein